jgi:hypothetical protein
MFQVSYLGRSCGKFSANIVLTLWIGGREVDVWGDRLLFEA